MYLSAEQNEKFIGAGKLNQQGQDLESFLANYDPTKYQNPSNTVDTLVFTYKEENGEIKICHLLLIQRGNHPSIGWWALPGGFVEYREDLDQAAKRELKEETGIDQVDVMQLKTYGAYDRDPRTRIITTAYVALVPEGSVRATAADDAADSGWFTIKDCCEQKSTDVDGKVHEKYKLMLHNEMQDITTQSSIEVTYNSGSLFAEKEYHVMETNLLAADHGAIILEGYHTVLKNLSSFKK
jgi:8-oxo-dGTP diphosphatase